MKTYQEFRDAVGKRESSNNYNAKNPWGFLGCYQFGKARLSDFGLTRLNQDKKFEWSPGFSEQIFLNSPALQDLIFDHHVALYRRMILSKYSTLIGKVFKSFSGEDIVLTLSGAVTCCHLVGPGGLASFVKGVDKADALNTHASEYIKLFANYEIPATLPFCVRRDEFLAARNPKLVPVA